MDNVRIGLEERDERGTEVWVHLRKLERQCGEDELEVTAILDTPRAEKRCSQTAAGEDPFCDTLCDCGLPRSGEPIEPEDWRPVEILGPLLDLIQHTLPGLLQATAPISVLVSGPMSATTTVQDHHIGCETCK